MSAVVEIASWFCLVGGAVFCVIGGIGIVRLPDVYSRTHAATITDTLGAGLILIGLALQAGPTLTALKLLMVLAFLLYTSPVGGHALVAAAYSGGVKAELDVPFASSSKGQAKAQVDASEPTLAAYRDDPPLPGTEHLSPKGSDDGLSD